MNDLLSNALARLPHGPEFRFLDRLTRLVPGKEGEGEYCVRGDAPFLRGHFPGQPLFPGVLLVEAGAQLAGVVAQSDPGAAPLADLRLTALRAVKITGTAQPAEVVRLHARITGRLGNLVHAEAQAWTGDVLIMEAQVCLAGAVA